MDTLQLISPSEVPDWTEEDSLIRSALDKIRDNETSPGDWERQLSAAAAAFVDVLLAGESQELEQASDPLRDLLAKVRGDNPAENEMRGWVSCLLALTRWGLERLPSEEEVSIGSGTLSFGFLMGLSGKARLASSDLREVLRTGDSQISRTGQGLKASGLVVQRRAGRQAFWELTPRGRMVVERLRTSDQTRADVLESLNSQPSTTRRRSRATKSAKRITQARPAHKSADRGQGTSLKQKQASGSQARSRRRAKVAAQVRGPRSAGKIAAAPAIAAYVSDRHTPSEVRYVVRSSTGWAISKSREGRIIENHGTDKPGAMSRAREIVHNAGGGQVIEVLLNGTEKAHSIPLPT